MTSADFKILLLECLLKYDNGLTLEETLEYGKQKFESSHHEFVRLDQDQPINRLAEIQKSDERKIIKADNTGLLRFDSNEAQFDRPERIGEE